MITGDCIKTPDETLIKLCNNTLIELYDESVTNIVGKYNFSYNDTLKKVHLPNLESIDSYQAFWNSTVEEFISENLETITGEGFTFIDSKLKKLIVPKLETIPVGLVNLCDNLEEVDFTRVKVINDNGLTYSNYTNNLTLKSLDLPYLETAEDFSICNWGELKKIWIPSSCTHLGYDCILSCPKITIYTSFLSKPSSWNDFWNIDNYPVVWGATHEEFLDA